MPMISRVRARTPSNAVTEIILQLSLVLGGSLLMALSARISIEVGLVPFTLQPLALALIVALLGWRRATLAMVAYLAEGASGMPVFAGGAAGAAVLVGPTAGYLWSYPIAAAAIGSLYAIGFTRNYSTRWIAIAAGMVIIYASGASVLALFVGPGRAIASGVVPFIVADLIKVSIAALLRPTGVATRG